MSPNIDFTNIVSISGAKIRNANAFAILIQSIRVGTTHAWSQNDRSIEHVAPLKGDPSVAQLRPFEIPRELRSFSLKVSFSLRFRCESCEMFHRTPTQVSDIARVSFDSVS